MAVDNGIEPCTLFGIGCFNTISPPSSTPQTSTWSFLTKFTSPSHKFVEPVFSYDETLHTLTPEPSSPSELPVREENIHTTHPPHHKDATTVSIITTALIPFTQSSHTYRNLFLSEEMLTKISSAIQHYKSLAYDFAAWFLAIGWILLFFGLAVYIIFCYVAIAVGIVKVGSAFIHDNYLHRRANRYETKISNLKATINTLQEAKQSTELKAAEQEKTSTRQHDLLKQQSENQRQEIAKITAEKQDAQTRLDAQNRERHDLFSEISLQKRRISRQASIIEHFEADPRWALKAVEDQLQSTKKELDHRKATDAQWRESLKKKERERSEETISRHIELSIEYSNEREEAFQALPGLKDEVSSLTTESTGLKKDVRELKLRVHNQVIEGSRMKRHLDRLRRQRDIARAESVALKSLRQKEAKPPKPPRHPGTFTVPYSSDSESDDSSDDAPSPPRRPSVKLNTSTGIPQPHRRNAMTNQATQTESAEDTQVKRSATSRTQGVQTEGPRESISSAITPTPAPPSPTLKTVMDRPGYVPGPDDERYLMSGALQTPLPPIDDDSEEAPLPEPFTSVEEPRKSVRFSQNVEVVDMSSDSAPSTIQGQQSSQQEVKQSPETDGSELLSPEEMDYAAELEREMSADDDDISIDPNSSENALLETEAAASAPSPAVDSPAQAIGAGAESSLPRSSVLPWLFQEDQMAEFRFRSQLRADSAPLLPANQPVQWPVETVPSAPTPVPAAAAAEDPVVVEALRPAPIATVEPRTVELAMEDAPPAMVETPPAPRPQSRTSQLFQAVVGDVTPSVSERPEATQQRAAERAEAQAELQKVAEEVEAEWASKAPTAAAKAAKKQPSQTPPRPSVSSLLGSISSSYVPRDPGVDIGRMNPSRQRNAKREEEEERKRMAAEAAERKRAGQSVGPAPPLTLEQIRSVYAHNAPRLGLPPPAQPVSRGTPAPTPSPARASPSPSTHQLPPSLPPSLRRHQARGSPTSPGRPAPRDTDDKDYLEAETDDARALGTMGAGSRGFEHRANATTARGRPMITPRSLTRRSQGSSIGQGGTRPDPTVAPSSTIPRLHGGNVLSYLRSVGVQNNQAPPTSPPNPAPSKAAEEGKKVEEESPAPPKKEE